MARAKILIPFFEDYHLSKYMPSLASYLADEGYQVDVLISRPEFAAKFDQKVNVRCNKLLDILHSRDKKSVLKSLSWMAGRILSAYYSSGYDLVLLLRDNRPLYHMLGMKTPSLVINSTIGTRPKAYMFYKYAGDSRELKDLEKKLDTWNMMGLKLFAPGFSNIRKGSIKNRRYAVPCADVKEYFVQTGATEDRVFLCGYPNLNFLYKKAFSAAEKQAKNPVFTFFFSNLEFSTAELEELRDIFKYLGGAFEQGEVVLKLHPKFAGDKDVASCLVPENLSVRVVAEPANDAENAALIAGSTAVFLKHSNVAMIALMFDVPTVFFDLTHKEDSFFFYVPGLTAIRSKDDLEKLSRLKNAAGRDQWSSAQKEAKKALLPEIDSPFAEVQKAVEQVIRQD